MLKETFIIAFIILNSLCMQAYESFRQTNLNSASIEILFLGDFDFGESYQSNPQYNDGINIIDKYGYDYMFENIKELLKTSNLTIANLETPLLDSINPTTSSRKPYIHWSYADNTVSYLQKYNVTVLSLANNHTLDYGAAGLDQTITAIRSNRLDCFGAALNPEEAGKPFLTQFFSADGDTTEIAVLTGFEYRKNYDSLYSFYAKENLPGVNVISVEKIKEQINILRNKHPDTFIIFFPHWGRNYLWKTEYQTETAHQLIDAGVDLIIGTGSHTVQEVEYYRGKWIVYGIGNSIFNAPGRYKSYNTKPYSFIAELVLRTNPEDKERHLRLYPIYTDNLNTNYQVRFLDENEVNDCYLTLKDKCADKKILNDEFRIKEKDRTKFFEIQLNY